jgi:Tol biopolymer transport system component
MFNFRQNRGMNRGRWFNIVIILLVFFGSAILSADGWGQAPRTPKIAFTSFRGGNDDIYLMDADGKNQRNLTNHPSGDYTPAWSPDGRRIAFYWQRPEGSGLYVMDADGKNQSPRLSKIKGFVYRDLLVILVGIGCFSLICAGSGLFTLPKFAIPKRDTSEMKMIMKIVLIVCLTLVLLNSHAFPMLQGKLLFSSYRESRNRQIYVMNPDGSQIRRLTHSLENESDTAPVWSPDGSQIAFQRIRDINAFERDTEIYVINADGSNPRNLTQHPALDARPSWSPDGSQIAFASSRDGGWNIYVMDVDGANVKRLTDNNLDFGFASRPSWSPNGEKIAYEGQAGLGRSIFVMHANGKKPLRLTDQGFVHLRPRWSPDGNRIIYKSSKDGTVNDASLNIMTKNGQHIETLRIPRTWALTSGYSWSSDGTHIAFTGREEKGEFSEDNWDIYLYDLNADRILNLTNDPTGDYQPDWSTSTLAVEPKHKRLISVWGRLKLAEGKN